ncbi:hypothetical protein HPB50_028521 [Hyalomma asiaticum]|nr:hypothetical protein HPB50_028521 [Hyalomma asiaticum]
MYLERVGGLDIVPMCVPRRRPRFVSRAALNPAPDHAGQCKQCCKLCGGAHATGTEGCTRKYKVPFVVTQRRWEKKNNERSTLSQADFPDLPPPSRGQWKQQESRAKGLEFREGGAFRGKEIKPPRLLCEPGTTTQEKMNFNQEGNHQHGSSTGPSHKTPRNGSHLTLHNTKSQSAAARERAAEEELGRN